MSLFTQYQIGAAIPARTTIEIEPGWQQIAIPARYGWWDTPDLVRGAPTEAKVGEYVLDQLVSKYGVGCIEVCNAKFGDSGVQWNFLPTTPRDSIHNFPLMKLDPETGLYEVVAFWIKSLYNDVMLLEVVEWRT